MTSPHAHPSPSLRIAPDDLLALLAVARLGKYTAAATSMGVNHTTVSRRIAALEKAVGERVLAASPDGWELTPRGRRLLPAAEAVEAALSSAASTTGRDGAADALTGTVRLAAPAGYADWFALPVLAQLQRVHPGLQVEVLTATQRARRYRSGVDIEVVVGRPDAPQSIAQFLRHYSLGLFASQEYIEENGEPESLAQMSAHRLIYYPEHSLSVEDLAHATEGLPQPAGHFRSNEVHLHVRATQLGVGIGLLPTTAVEEAPADRGEHRAGRAGRTHDGPGGPTHPTLVRVLPAFSRPMEYWAAVRPEVLRRPAVEQVLLALRDGLPSAARTESSIQH
ncbi:MAG: LysR family transcriptional regulator [Brevibacterium yomogidense]